MLTQDDIYRIIGEQVSKGYVSEEFFDFNGIDVKEALDIGLIRKCDNGYVVISSSEVRRFIDKCSLIRDFATLEKAYEYYCILNPNSVYAWEYYFSCLLKNKNYEKAYEVFKKLLELKSYNFAHEEYLFTLLFSRIMTIPLDDLHAISYIQLNDVLVPDDDSRFYDIKVINEARRCLFNGSEKKAISFLSPMLKDKKDNSPMVIINMIDLASAGIYAENERNAKVKALVEKERYEEALLVYKALAGRTILKYKDDAIKHLLETLVLLRQGLPVVNNDLYNKGFVFELILHNNFILAKQRNGSCPGLTNAINPMISFLLNKVVDTLTDVKEDISIEDIKSAFALGDYNKLFRLVQSYLHKQNKDKYYSFTVMLFAYDALSNENNAITFLEDPKSSLDISKIKDDFYNNFKQRSYALALVNYHMLNFINREILPLDDLESFAEKISHKRLEIDQKDDDVLLEISNAAGISVANLPLPRVLNDNRDFIKYHRIFNEVIFKKSFVIFKSKNRLGFNDLVANAEQNKEIKVSTIIVGDEHICFVKYNMPSSEDEMQKNIVLGDNANLSGNPLMAIRYYKIAICMQNTFDLSLMVKVATCYLKLSDYKMAREYFYCASALCQVRGLPDLYAGYVTDIKVGKPISKETICTIEDSLDFDLVGEYVAKKVVSENIPFEEVLASLKLAPSRVCELKLYYAEYAYALGNYEFGDEIINNIVMMENAYYSVKASELFAKKEELLGTIEPPEFVRSFILK